MYAIPTFGWHFMVNVDKYTMNPVILSIKLAKISWSETENPPTFTPVAPWCRDGWSHACANNPRPCFIRNVFPPPGGAGQEGTVFFPPVIWGEKANEEISCEEFLQKMFRWRNHLLDYMTIWARSYSNSSTKIGEHETETTWQRNTL